MTIADQYLAEARKEIGYTESPSGSNKTKFASEAGHPNGQPWCATFLVALARRTGLAVPASAYTPTMAGIFKQRGQWGTTPRVGAFAFHDFPDSVKRIQHVDVVEAILENGSVVTIGGNTSSSDAGSQSNGGGVWRRTRSRKSIVGFGYPAYSTAPTPTPDPGDDDMAIIVEFPHLPKDAQGQRPFIRVNNKGETFANNGAPEFKTLAEMGGGNRVDVIAARYRKDAGGKEWLDLFVEEGSFTGDSPTYALERR